MYQFSFTEHAVRNDFSLSLSFSDYEEAIEEPEHTHDFQELVLVTRGSGIHLFNGERFQIGSGNVFFVVPGQSHSYINTDHLALYSFLFFEPILSPFRRELEQLNGFHLLFNLEPNMALENRMAGNLYLPGNVLATAIIKAQEIQRDFQNFTPEYKLNIWCNFIQLVTLIVSHCRVSSRSHVYHSADKISRILAYLERNYSQKINLELLARQVNMLVGNFRRIFTETMSVSPIQYILNLRLEKAARLLIEFDVPISTVAGETGFADSNYFSHQFHRKFGVSPMKYRQLYCRNNRKIKPFFGE